MNFSIQFIYGIEEEIIPTIRLTRSRDGTTGTAIFTFINPSTFKKSCFENQQIEGLHLIMENKVMSTRHIKLFFSNGKPKYVQAIFIFKTKQSIGNFITFMEQYAIKHSLFFQDLKK